MSEANDFELIVLKGLQRALKSAIDTGKDASQIDRLRAQLRAKEEEIAAKTIQERYGQPPPEAPSAAAEPKRAAHMVTVLDSDSDSDEQDNNNNALNTVTDSDDDADPRRPRKNAPAPAPAAGVEPDPAADQGEQYMELVGDSDRFAGDDDVKVVAGGRTTAGLLAALPHLGSFENAPTAALSTVPSNRTDLYAELPAELTPVARKPDPYAELPPELKPRVKPDPYAELPPELKPRVKPDPYAELPRELAAAHEQHKLTQPPQYAPPPSELLLDAAPALRSNSEYGVAPPALMAPHRQKLHRTTRAKDLSTTAMTRDGLTVPATKDPATVGSLTPLPPKASRLVPLPVKADSAPDAQRAKKNKAKHKSELVPKKAAAAAVAADQLVTPSRERMELLERKRDLENGIEQVTRERDAASAETRAGHEAVLADMQANLAIVESELAAPVDAPPLSTQPKRLSMAPALMNLRMAIHNRSFAHPKDGEAGSHASGSSSSSSGGAASGSSAQSASEHQWKLERLSLGASCSVCRSAIFSVLLRQGYRCARCGDTSHSSCLVRAKYACAPPVRLSTGTSVARRSSDHTIVEAEPAAASDLRARRFVQLINLGNIDELTKAFTHDEIRAQMSQRFGADRDLPIVTAMRAFVYSPSAQGEAMFLWLLRLCPAELLNSSEPGNSWTPFLWAIELSTENAEPFLAMKRVPNMHVAADALCHFARHYRLPDSIPENIDWLIAHGADINGRGGSHGDSPLHYACSNISIGPMLVSALVARGANVSQQNHDGLPPLFACVFCNNVAVAQQLLDMHGVSPTPRDRDGNTPADLCAKYETHAELFKLLTAAAEAGSSVDSTQGTDVLVADDLVGDEEDYDDVDLALKAAMKNVPDDDITSSDTTTNSSRQQVPPPAHESSSSSSSGVNKVKSRRVKALASRRAPLSERGSADLLAELDSDLSRSLMAKLNRSQVIDESRKRDMLIDYRDVAFYERLGSGTYGQVFRGTLRTTAALAHGAAGAKSGQELVTIPVAIKQLIKVPTGREDRRTSSFLRQFEAWMALDHPNLVFLYGVVLKPSLLLVMEHASRGSLLDALQAPQNRIDWARALAWVTDIALGTRALHEHSPPVYHRDLKPSNVLVDDNWRLKISDFDTARLFEADNMATFESKIVGSPAYMAVEIFTGQKFTQKSDIYSIGVMLNEMAARVVTGQHYEPYSGCDVPSLQGGIGVLIYASGVKQGRPIVEPKTPKLFRQLIEQSWNADPEKRPTCAELHAALKPMIADLTAHKANWPAACDRS